VRAIARKPSPAASAALSNEHETPTSLGSHAVGARSVSEVMKRAVVGKGGGTNWESGVYAIVSSLILSTRYTTYYTHMPCAAHCCAFARCGTLRLSLLQHNPFLFEHM
jgi:hypothetical protein